LAYPGTLAVEECSGYGVGDHGCGVEVDDGAVDDLWLAFGFSLEGAHAGDALEDLVVAGLVLERAGVAVAGQSAIDDAGVDGLKGSVVDAEPRRNRWAEVVHEHVGFPDELQQDTQAFGLLEIEDDTALAAICSEKGA